MSGDPDGASRPPMVAMPDATRDKVRGLLECADLEARYMVVASRFEFTVTAADDINDLVATLGSSFLGSAVDHLRGWQDWARAGRQPLHAHATLTRGVLDGAVAVLWMLDGPGDTQLARSVAWKRRDLEERGDFEAAAGVTAATDQPGGKTAEQRRTMLGRQAKDRAIPRVAVPRWTVLYRDYAIARPPQPLSGQRSTAS